MRHSYLALLSPSPAWLAPCPTCDAQSAATASLAATIDQANRLFTEARALQNAMLDFQISVRRLSEETTLILKELRAAAEHPTCPLCKMVAGAGHGRPLQCEPFGRALVCAPCARDLERRREVLEPGVSAVAPTQSPDATA